MKISVRAAAAATLLGLAAALAAPAASAAIVTGHWDPALPDPPFTNLGWTTTINLQVDPACSSGAQSLPYIVNIFGRSFGCGASFLQSTSPFSILSAQIGIYDLSSRLLVDVLTFDRTSFTPVLANLSSSGEITYLLSLTDSNAVAGHIAADAGDFFRLSLPGAAPAIKYSTGSSGRYVTAPGTPTEIGYEVNPDSEQASVLSRTALQVGDPVFGSVPEPGSFALAALALGAAGAVAQRRRDRKA